MTLFQVSYGSKKLPPLQNCLLYKTFLSLYLWPRWRLNSCLCWEIIRRSGIYQNDKAVSVNEHICAGLVGISCGLHAPLIRGNAFHRTFSDRFLSCRIWSLFLVGDLKQFYIYRCGIRAGICGVTFTDLQEWSSLHWKRFLRSHSRRRPEVDLARRSVKRMIYICNYIQTFLHYLT